MTWPKWQNESLYVHVVREEMRITPQTDFSVKAVFYWGNWGFGNWELGHDWHIVIKEVAPIPTKELIIYMYRHICCPVMKDVLPKGQWIECVSSPLGDHQGPLSICMDFYEIWREVIEMLYKVYHNLTKMQDTEMYMYVNFCDVVDDGTRMRCVQAKVTNWARFSINAYTIYSRKILMRIRLEFFTQTFSFNRWVVKPQSTSLN